MTSSLARSFEPGYAMYSVSRAGRDAFMGVLAAEQPNVRLLSYDPGACDTDMMSSIPKRFLFEDEVTDPRDAVGKLVGLLREDKYKNASVVEYLESQ